MAGGQVHGGETAVRLHELQVDGVQALVEAGLEGADVPASFPTMLRWCHDSRPCDAGPESHTQASVRCNVYTYPSGGNVCWWLRADCTLPMWCYSAHRRILGVR